MDLRTVQRHRSPKATSRAVYKGAVAGGGRTIFQGLIEVAPGASGTDAYLTNRNLILGEGARSDSIPTLKIGNNDVKCSHGSTTGRLNAEELFYLESRGLSDCGSAGDARGRLFRRHTHPRSRRIQGRRPGRDQGPPPRRGLKLVMNGWVKVASAEEVVSTMSVTVDGVPVALFRTEEGIFALDDICSHEYSKLSEGDVWAGEVYCQKHGSRFNLRTGAVTGLPATKPVGDVGRESGERGDMDRITHEKAQLIGTRSVEDVRGDFPLLDRTVNGRPLAYLDNAATSQKPRLVLDAIRVYYEHGNANVHRALHTLGEEATAAYEEARGKVQRLLNARASREIIFTRGTTEAINLVASSWADTKLSPGRRRARHGDGAPQQPRSLAACLRAPRMHAPLHPPRRGWHARLAEAERTWDPRTRLVAVTYVSNVLGTINDVKAIAAMAHERGAAVLVDGAQAVPHLRVDVQDIDCDFFAFSGHKVYGPMGIGALYGKEKILDAMPPWMGGGEMIRSVIARGIDLERPAMEVRGGHAERRRGRRPQRGDRLPARPRAALHRDVGGGAGGVRAGTPRRRARADPVRSGAAAKRRVLPFTLGEIHAHDVAQFLDREGIAVRAGHHCAQPLARKLGVPATVRASLAFYNTFSEIDRLVDALEGALRFYA